MRTPRYDTRPIPSRSTATPSSASSGTRSTRSRSDGSLRVTGRNFLMRADVDLYRGPSTASTTLDLHAARREPSARAFRRSRILYRHPCAPSLAVRDRRLCPCLVRRRPAPPRRRRTRCPSRAGSRQLIALTMGPPLARLGFLAPHPTSPVVNGSLSDAIIDLDGDCFYLQGSVRPASLYLQNGSARPSATVAATTVHRWRRRAAPTDTQQALGETPTSAAVRADRRRPDPPRRGSTSAARIGTYFREVFFHIPFLIAEPSQRPAAVRGRPALVPLHLRPHRRRRHRRAARHAAGRAGPRQRDRVWRYVEFRGLDVPTLRQVLTDPAAIEVYKSDPFNPHAIARLRLSAYQKCIVMRYVDNLLDWGDSLFAEFTTESVNEATVLYVMAADILGPTPGRAGQCGEATVTPRTYEAIGPLVRSGSEFLAELETLLWSHNPRGRCTAPGNVSPRLPFHRAEIAILRRQGCADRRRRQDVPRTADGDGRTTAAVAEVVDWSRDTPRVLAGRHDRDRDARTARLIADFELVPRFGWSVIRQLTPVFCDPAQPGAAATTGTASRTGCTRSGTAWTSPACAGSSRCSRRRSTRGCWCAPGRPGCRSTDVLESTSGDLPPYRFTYLVEKAKQYAALVQSFGVALLGRAGEEGRRGADPAAHRAPAEPPDADHPGHANAEIDSSRWIRSHAGAPEGRRAVPAATTSQVLLDGDLTRKRSGCSRSHGTSRRRPSPAVRSCKARLACSVCSRSSARRSR